MKKFGNLLLFLAIALSFPASTVAQEPTEEKYKVFLPVVTSSQVAPAPKIEETTPFQTIFKQVINERKAAGLPVPSVTYEYQVTPDQAGQNLTGATAPTSTIKITSKTIIYFDGPEQAGYEKWPALVVKDNLPPDVEGAVLEGDYTETYRKTMEEKFPGIWKQYEFGHEPRKHTIRETIEFTYPEERLLAPGSMPVAEAVTSEQILTGFTYTGPHLDYAIEDEWEECFLGICVTIYYFKAGFELDWALGLRLPAEASLIGPDQMIQGSPYSFNTAITPLDWSATDYSNTGVAAEGGNEFVLRMIFFAGVQVEVLGVDLCPSCYARVDVDRSTSFITPFGPGAFFPIPPANIPVKEFDMAAFYFGVGFQLDPKLGSDKITADWQASSDASGNGLVTYSNPGTSVPFGPVNAADLDPSDQAQIRLTEFRYWFNQFLIELSATLEFELFGYGVWDPSFSIYEFDLSDLSSGLYLGAHKQCDWDFTCQAIGPDNSIELSIPVAPPTSIELTSFTAQANGDGVVLNWETAAELDSEGFNIWRSETADGLYVKVNLSLIPAQGNADTGASYQYIDIDVVQGTTYYYKLEDLDTGGVSTFHGPILVRASSPQSLYSRH